MSRNTVGLKGYLKMDLLLNLDIKGWPKSTYVLMKLEMGFYGRTLLKPLIFL